MEQTHDYGEDLLKKGKVIYVGNQTKIQYKISVIMDGINENDLYSFRRRVALLVKGVLVGMYELAEIHITVPDKNEFLLDITFDNIVDARKLGLISSNIVRAVNDSMDIGEIHFLNVPFNIVQMEF